MITDRPGFQQTLAGVIKLIEQTATAIESIERNGWLGLQTLKLKFQLSIGTGAVVGIVAAVAFANAGRQGIVLAT